MAKHFALACGLDQTGSDEPLPVLGHNVRLGLGVGADWPAAEGPTWAAMASMNSRSFSEISDSADSTTTKVFRRWAAVMARRTPVSSSFQASLLASTQKVVANKLNQEGIPPVASAFTYETGGDNTDNGTFVQLAVPAAALAAAPAGGGDQASVAWRRYWYTVSRLMP